MFVIHLLGDAFSPPLIGGFPIDRLIADCFLGAFAAAALSGAILLYGAKFAPRLKFKMHDCI